MKTTWLFLLILFAITLMYATGNPPFTAARAEALNQRALNSKALKRQWLNAADRPSQEAQIKQDITALVLRWSDAIQRRDSDTVEKILADDFTGVGCPGQTITKSNVLAALKLFPVEWEVIEDVRVRVHELFPVVTFRSTSGFKVGTDTFTQETLNSMQFRRCSRAEHSQGFEAWLITSATHLPVHQMPLDYWTKENLPKRTP